MNTVKRLIDTAQNWNGYLEKKSDKDLDHFTANAGSNNYTCFARDYKIHTSLNLQAQPWCAMFVSEVFVQAFGLETTKKLLCGSLYHYCPTGVNQFKAAGRWCKSPEPGDIIFFTNGQRAYHTGIVTEVTASRVKTIEGNTSGASGVVENGGGVCQKSYRLVESRIMGYGRPDYSLVQQPTGWIRDNTGWWYRHQDGSYTTNDWEQIDGKWYWFDGAGYAVQNAWKQGQAGEWYYLGQDCSMVISCLKPIGNELFAFNQNGAMITGEVKLRTNDRGALTL